MKNKVGKHIAGLVLGGGLIAGLFGAGTGEAQTTASLPRPSQSAEALGDARPLLAWIDFCRRYPRECAVDTSEPAIVALTPRTWQTIVSVNQTVNASVKPLTDAEHWGTPDHWDFPSDGSGDCEDYQLLKRKLLVRRGLPQRALRMTVVRDDKGEGHAVLMIRTDRGDFVLDNKTSRVLSWNQTGYAYVKRESQDAVGWVALGGAASPIATANR